MIRHKLRLIPAVACAIAACGTAYADADIRGFVYSKNSSLPLDYVSVRLLDPDTGEGTPYGTYTADDGSFILSDIPSGDYIVAVSNIGSIAQERPVTVGDADLDMGHIDLADDAKLLEEVVVVAERAGVKMEADRRVFNVSSNISAAGATAEELLASLPSVDVDHDGTVALRGDTNVAVWIDGKESGMTPETRAQMLRQLPAGAVESVEVLTNPSAKHSAETSGGVINIRLRRDNRRGYNVGVDLAADSHGGVNANVNAAYTRGKFEWFGGLGAKALRSPKGSESHRLYADGRTLDSSMDGKERDNSVFLRLGANYSPDASNMVYFSAMGTLGHQRVNSTTRHLSDLPSLWTSLTTTGRETNDSRGANILAGYKHTFGAGHFIDVSASYNFWKRPDENLFFEQSVGDGGAVEEVTEMQTQEVKLNNTEVAVDYSNAIGPWIRLDAGFKGNYNRESSPSAFFSGVPGTDLRPVNALANHYMYDTDISALYVSAEGSAGRFSYGAGLRAEAWQTRTRSLGYGQTEADVAENCKNGFALFPSASLGYNLSGSGELALSYSRRIKRPYGPQLNTFVNVSDPSEVHLGNPLIQPEYSNNLELSYIGRFGAHTLTAAAYLRTSSDMISHISFLAPLATDPEVMTMYYGHANVGNRVNAGMEVISRNVLFSRLTLTTTVNLYNSHFKAWSTEYPLYGSLYPISGPARDKLVWSVSAQASVRLPWDLSLQVTGRYRSQRLMAQGTAEPDWNVEAALRKNFGAWGVSVVCKDIFDSQRSREVLAGNGYTQSLDKWSGGRTLRVGVSYTFGKSSSSSSSTCTDPFHQHIDTGGYGEAHSH